MSPRTDSAFLEADCYHERDGSGKSTLIAELCKRGFTVVPQPARIVLAERRAAGGDGVPERSPQRFCDLMLERMKRDYDERPRAYDRQRRITSGLTAGAIR
jgi:predicted ATPase